MWMLTVSGQGVQAPQVRGIDLGFFSPDHWEIFLIPLNQE
jgi:hypothetical protein